MEHQIVAAHQATGAGRAVRQEWSTPRRQEEAAKLAALEKARQKEREEQLERKRRLMEQLDKLKAAAANVPIVPLKDK